MLICPMPEILNTLSINVFNDTIGMMSKKSMLSLESTQKLMLISFMSN